MEKQLSIIIPCYNVEKYVYACLESCAKQGLLEEEYEIITVNDGSTDNTQSVINEFCSKNPSVNLVVINQKNMGLSAARNVGLKYAKGKYILFLDSDDTFLDNTVSKVLNCACDEKLDMLWFNHELVNERGMQIELPATDRKQNVTSNLCSGIEFLLHEFNHSCMVCMFMFRREFLLQNAICFTEGIYMEDIVFTLTCLKFCERVRYLPITVYSYLIRSNSTMRDVSKIRKRALDSMQVAALIIKEYSEANFVEARKWIEDFANGIIQYNLRRLIKSKDRDGFSQCISMLKEYEIYPLPTSFVFKQNILTHILNISPRLYWFTASILK